jgi:hypothetical protein
MKASRLARIGTPSTLFALAFLFAPTALSHDKNFKTELESYQEVPAVSSGAGGEFKARLNNEGSAVAWELSYSAFSTAVLQAHIHFGQKGVNGGISVFLCSNLGNGPAGTQACPEGPATISGTFTAAAVVGPSGQGIAAGEFAELIEAIRSGIAYANVHTTQYPGGEIRGQLK